MILNFLLFLLGFSFNSMKLISFCLLSLLLACSSPPQTANVQATHTLFGEGNMDKTIQFCNETVGKYSDNLTAYLLRAEANLQSKRFQEALNDANYVLKLNPNEALGYIIRAEAQGNLGYAKEALADLDKAQALAHTGWQPDICVLKYKVKIFLKDSIGACQEWENAQKLGVGHLLPSKCQ